VLTILIIFFSFKKAFFNFNFVNKVEMYVLPFKISDRKTTALFCLRDYAILILMNHSICQKWVFRYFVLSKRYP